MKQEVYTKTVEKMEWLLKQNKTPNKNTSKKQTNILSVSLPSTRMSFTLNNQKKSLRFEYWLVQFKLQLNSFHFCGST